MFRAAERQYMNKFEETFLVADPWLKKADKTTRLPDDVRFACAYGLNIGPDIIEEASFFLRTELTDELWIAIGYSLPSLKAIAVEKASLRDIERAVNFGIGCAFAVPRKGEELPACLNLLDQLFRARVGFYWPERLVAAGIVDEPAFNSLAGRIKHELEGNAKVARETESEIIKVARELGLFPQPTGTGSNH